MTEQQVLYKLSHLPGPLSDLLGRVCGVPVTLTTQILVNEDRVLVFLRVSYVAQVGLEFTTLVKLVSNF